MSKTFLAFLSCLSLAAALLAEDSQVDIGSPAKARSLTDEQGVIDVRTFGAKGDGVTDDTAAIQNALNAATKNRTSVRINTMRGWYGGSVSFSHPMVLFASGTYKISDTLVGYREMYLHGENGSMIRQENPGKDILYQHKAHRTTIENLGFNGGRTQVKVWTGNQNAAMAVISGCRFENSSSEAVWCLSRSKDFPAEKKWANVKMVGPYEIQEDAEGFYKITSENDLTNLKEWFNSTLFVIEDSKFNGCIRAFNISTDETAVEDCEIVANPETEGPVMRCAGKMDLKRLRCNAPSEGKPKYWIEADTHTIAIRNSAFESKKGMCLVKVTRKPGYFSTGLLIDGNKINSAGCQENGIVSLDAVPNALYMINNTETSGETVKAVAWNVSSDVEALSKHRYFKAIDIATQFNFCIDGNSASIDSQLPETVAPFIRPDIPAGTLAAVQVDVSVFPGDSSPRIENPVFATECGVKADGQSDDTAALETAVNTAAKLPNSAVVLPGKVMKLGSTVHLPPGTKLIAAGYAFMTGDGSFPALSGTGGGDLLIKNVGFCNFTKGIDWSTKAADKSHVLVSNASFFDCFDTAMNCLSDKPGPENGTVIETRNVVSESTLYLVTNAAHARISNVWLQGNFLADNQAYVENRGGTMLVESFLGVPQSMKGKTLKNALSGTQQTWELGDNLRWVDNYGKLAMLDPRFGGESGGACPVFSKSAEATVFIQGGHLSATGAFVKQHYGYFEVFPKAAAFMMLGNIPGPRPRTVWGTPEDVNDEIAARVFVSGPGVGIRDH